MKEIKRDNYLEKLVKRMDNGLIKIITGLRRSGKSYLLEHIFKDYLVKEGINNNHIIYLSFDNNLDFDFDIKNAKLVLEFIKSKIKDNKKYYLLLDEVQKIGNNNEFVDVLNSLLHLKNVDIYVTGSNSKFLSKDIATEFRGRGDVIHLYPLTFKEYIESYKGSIYEAFDDYFLYGGLPLILSYDSDEDKAKYLKNLFAETYTADIKERYDIKNPVELDELLNILSSNVGSLTNPSKLANTFKSLKKSDISDKTINTYISYLEDAFLINKSIRYDIKGKKFINTPLKYYFEDIGLRNARLNFINIDEGHTMENIIYNELLARGFNIDVGVVEIYSKNNQDKTERIITEVDFIANLGNKKYYIQSSYNLNNNEKVVQESRPLYNIDDSFKKIIIVKDDIKPRRDDYGITTMGIYYFLLNENSLDD